MPSRIHDAPVGNPLERHAVNSVNMVLAGSLLVFIRHDIGVRLLRRRSYLIALALAVWWGAYMERPLDRWLIGFTAAVVVLVFVHHFRHMRRIRRGNPEWHSYDTGKSLLSSVLPLPRGLVLIVIEPALCGLLGWWLLNRSNATFYLGSLIIVAAGLLFIVEIRLLIARRNALVDIGDAFVESVYFSERAENFAQQAQSAASPKKPARNPSWLMAVRGLWAASQAARNSKRYQREAEAQRRQRRQQEEAEAANRQKQEQEREQEAQAAWRDPTAGRMTPEQALEILELKAGASAADIRAAYNRLMQKVHPDTGGSTFFAKQLNLARDTLLRPQRKSG